MININVHPALRVCTTGGAAQRLQARQPGWVNVADNAAAGVQGSACLPSPTAEPFPLGRHQPPPYFPALRSICDLRGLCLMASTSHLSASLMPCPVSAEPPCALTIRARSSLTPSASATCQQEEEACAVLVFKG